MINNKLTIYTSDPLDVQVTPGVVTTVIVHAVNRDPRPELKPKPGYWLQTSSGPLLPITGQDRYFYIINSGAKIGRNIWQIVKFSLHLTIIYCIGLYLWAKRRIK